MSSTPARRILTEMVVIVGSILLAFALDAWWDERSERARVDELLDAVAIEFEAEVAVLDSILVTNRARVEQITALVARSDPALPRISSDSISIVADYHRGAQVYDPAFGALTALIESGGLQSVESVELQRALAGWSGELDDLTWEVDQLYDAIDRMLDRTVEVGASSRSLLSEDRVEVNYRLTFSDPGIREMVAEIGLAHHRYVTDLARIRDRAAQVALQIRAR